MNSLNINFVVPRLDEKKFAGGIYCILKHADGLARRGHTVNVIPDPQSKKPQWIDCRANFLFSPEEGKFRRRLGRNCLGKERFKTPEMKRTMNALSVAERIPQADITVATLWSTAPIVFEYGTGVRAYFMQHFEPVFATKGSLDELLAQHSYLYPLHKIANSSWLKNVTEKFLLLNNIGEKVNFASNAVDLDIYRRISPPVSSADNRCVRIISYGGRGVVWKGFQEMAQGIAMARQRLPEFTLEWLVYGEAALPPDNKIAPYIHLGFLQPRELADAYNSADILLSASWYESFPLFPIEAMACGLAVITTSKGTEDYAIDGDTAQVVRPQDPESIAEGIIRVVKDSEYRRCIAEKGYSTALKFSWETATIGMENVIRGLVEKGEMFSSQEREQPEALLGLL